MPAAKGRAGRWAALGTQQRWEVPAWQQHGEGAVGRMGWRDLVLVPRCGVRQFHLQPQLPSARPRLGHRL